MVNDTTRLLGLDGLVAERVELDAAGVPVVDLSTGCEQARCCPQCGQRAAACALIAHVREGHHVGAGQGVDDAVGAGGVQVMRRTGQRGRDLASRLQ
jgi:hypothetical protein